MANWESDDELHQPEGLGELALARRGVRLRSGFVIITQDRTIEGPQAISPVALLFLAA